WARRWATASPFRSIASRCHSRRASRRGFCGSGIRLETTAAGAWQAFLQPPDSWRPSWRSAADLTPVSPRPCWGRQSPCERREEAMASVVYQSPWMNDELRMFRKSVRQFIERDFVPHQACWRQQHRPDAEAWTAAGGNGLLLPDVPDEYGGGGGTFAHQAVVVEELAHAGVQFGYTIHNVVAHNIVAFGTDEQRR